MSLFDDEDFAHLHPTGTARYTLSQVCIPRSNPDPVVLILKPAGASNDAYQSALVKAPRAVGKDAVKQMIGLFARHVIAGWENVQKDGKPVPYTRAGGEELLLKLIESKRDDIAMGAVFFARDADNFRAPIVDTGDLGNG
jgi:hypothetical protein